MSSIQSMSHSSVIMAVIVAGVSMGLSCLFALNLVQASQDDIPKVDESKMMSHYQAALADGQETAAVKIVLDYTEKDSGEYDPATVKLTQRYGYLLYQDGKYRQATDVLKKALERSTVAFGKSGGEAFELNMNIAYANSQWRTGLSPRTKYFNRALEILRERGEHESIAYVTALINITVNLMDSGSLGGSYTSHLSDTLQSSDLDDFQFPIEGEYSNKFHIAERYVLEAVEVGGKLEDLDEYISSKIAILQAKLKVMETADLAAVPMGVGGYISGGTAGDYYDREEERLYAAIDELSRDTDTNQIFLEAANKVLMEIAWIDKDNNRMADMCTTGTLNSASEYPPDRLYEVMEGGMVIAPELPRSISKNLFKHRVSRRETELDSDGNPVKRPYFKPVCIDGRLMAALIHVPRVTVEEILVTNRDF